VAKSYSKSRSLLVPSFIVGGIRSFEKNRLAGHSCLGERPYFDQRSEKESSLQIGRLLEEGQHVRAFLVHHLLSGFDGAFDHPKDHPIFGDNLPPFVGPKRRAADAESQHLTWRGGCRHRGK
jgi:hypothetical protein